MDKEEIRLVSRVEYNNQGWAVGALKDNLVYKLICEFVSMRGPLLHIRKTP